MKIQTKVPLVRLAAAAGPSSPLRLHQSLVSGRRRWPSSSRVPSAGRQRRCRPPHADTLPRAPRHELRSGIINPDALGRLLRALISRGIFRRRSDGRYDLTPLARTLRWATQDSVAASCGSLIGARARALEPLHHAVRTGRSVILVAAEASEWLQVSRNCGRFSTRP
jgi:hypothetical protein